MLHTDYSRLGPPRRPKEKHAFSVSPLSPPPYPPTREHPTPPQQPTAMASAILGPHATHSSTAYTQSRSQTAAHPHLARHATPSHTHRTQPQMVSLTSKAPCPTSPGISSTSFGSNRTSHSWSSRRVMMPVLNLQQHTGRIDSAVCCCYSGLPQLQGMCCACSPFPPALDTLPPTPCPPTHPTSPCTACLATRFTRSRQILVGNRTTCS